MATKTVSHSCVLSADVLTDDCPRTIRLHLAHGIDKTNGVTKGQAYLWGALLNEDGTTIINPETGNDLMKKVWLPDRVFLKEGQDYTSRQLTYAECINTFLDEFKAKLCISREVEVEVDGVMVMARTRPVLTRGRIVELTIVDHVISHLYPYVLTAPMVKLINVDVSENGMEELAYDIREREEAKTKAEKAKATKVKDATTSRRRPSPKMKKRASK